MSSQQIPNILSVRSTTDTDTCSRALARHTRRGLCAMYSSTFRPSHFVSRNNRSGVFSILIGERFQKLLAEPGRSGPRPESQFALSCRFLVIFTYYPPLLGTRCLIDTINRCLTSFGTSSNKLKLHDKRSIQCTNAEKNKRVHTSSPRGRLRNIDGYELAVQRGKSMRKNQARSSS